MKRKEEIIFNNIKNFIYSNGMLTIETKFGIFTSNVNIPLETGEFYFPSCTDEIKNILYNYCINSDFPDIELFAYDISDNNLYRGKMLFSEIQNKNYGYTDKECKYNIGKYNTDIDDWEEIYAIIRSDGSYIVNPLTYCDLCILFFTEKEWNEFKQPPKTKDNQYNYEYKWDFVKEEWVDSRTKENMISLYKGIVEGYFDELDKETLNFYINDIIPVYSKLIKFLFKEHIDISLVEKNKKNGIESINKFLGINYQEKEKYFSDDFYIKMYINAIEYIDGQRQVWLNYPNSNQTKFDLSKNYEWDRLIEYFENWFDRLYLE